MRKKQVGMMFLVLALAGSSFYSSAGQFHQVYANETAIDTQTQTTKMDVMDFLNLCDPNTLINITVTEEQAAEMLVVIHEVTKNATKDYEKAKAIYDWVAKELKYTPSGTATIFNEPYDVFIHKRAICGGFSNLLKEMLNLAGIPAAALVGTFSEMPHQWNAVYVNGEWVYADATASGYFDHESIPTTHNTKEVPVAKITVGDVDLGYYDGLAVTGSSSTSVQIPTDYEGHPITSISYTLFGTNYNVQELYIHENITSVEVDSLSGSSKIKSISVAEGNTVYASHEKALFTADLSQLLVYPAAREETEFTLPKETRSFDIKEIFSNSRLQNLYVEEGNAMFSSYDGALYNVDKTQLEMVPPGKTTITVYGDATISDIAFANVDTSQITIIAKAGSPAAEYAKMYHMTLREEPEITPKGGEYEGEQQITIFTHSDKAKIYYTIDGTDPTMESTLYTEPFIIDHDTVIKAIAVEEGQTESAVVTEEYSIRIPVEVTEAPTISPEGGEYKEAQQITITGKSEQAKIYYTTDGTDPTTASTLYTAPFTIDRNTTIKVMAIEEGKEKSTVVSQEYKIAIPTPVQITEAPTISPEGGEYKEAQQITITGKSEQAKIYYTTDGTDPTTASTLYTEPFTIDRNTTIKAMAIEEGKEKSTVVSQEYKIMIPTPVQVTEAPTISPEGGEYKEAQQITITGKSEQAKIYYTTDGTDPTTASTLYTEPFTIDSNTTIKAIAIEEGKQKSTVVSKEYKIAIPTPVQVTEAPTISPEGGEYKEAQQITITGKSEQAKIYYTTDGTDPTTASTLYTAPFTIDRNTTIKAMAIEEGKEKSTVVSQEYMITISDSVDSVKKQQVTAPVIRPESGTFTSAQEITITSATKDAVIYYTTDGSQPTTQSTKYTAPVKLVKSATIRAIAVKNGWEDSEITTVAYTIEKPWIFTDVTQNGGWKHLAVKYVYDNDIMGAVGASQEFQPDNSLTRAMFATVLYRMAGSPEVTYTSVFEDVPQGKWFSDAVIWAYRNKIVSGVGDGSSYGIDLKITREQIAKMLCEYANTCKYDTTSVKSLDDFTDVDSVSSWAVKYMQWAVAVEMVTGKPNDDQKTWRMDPKGNATRAECAAMLQRFANRYMQ